MRNKKGQAAMEFLTTYGWAFLIIIVAIMGLYYMDVFSFDGALTTSFSLDNNLQAGESFAVDLTNNQVQMAIKNNNEVAIDVVSIVMYEKGMKEFVDIADCTFTGIVAGTEHIPTGVTNDIAFTIDESMSSAARQDNCGLFDSASEKKSFIVNVQYTSATSAIETTSAGEMTLTVGDIVVTEINYEKCDGGSCDGQRCSGICVDHIDADCECM